MMRPTTAILALLLAACRAEPEPAPVATTTPMPDLLTDDVTAGERSGPRVLYVEHWPRWEYRFLKNAMLRDRPLRVRTLLTSADPSYVQDASRGLDPIVEFPPTMKDLLEYDALILGDVSLEKIGGDDAAKRIVAFVREHGRGLIFIAGTEFNPHRYAGSPLEALLPVVPAGPGLSSWDRDLQYRLTPAGETDVITSMEADEGRLLKSWDDIPLVRYYVPCALRPGATTLVELRDPPESEPAPLFATMAAGRGRVFFSATDETYRWRRLRGDFPFFYPFWKRVISWVAGS